MISAAQATVARAILRAAYQSPTASVPDQSDIFAREYSHAAVVWLIRYDLMFWEGRALALLPAGRAAAALLAA